MRILVCAQCLQSAESSTKIEAMMNFMTINDLNTLLLLQFRPNLRLGRCPPRNNETDRKDHA